MTLREKALSLLFPAILVLGAGISFSATVPADAPADMTTLTAFDALERPDSPNHWLVAPAAAGLEADAVAPLFAISATQLAQRWGDVLRQQPRTRIVAQSSDHLQIEAEQRSAWFGFVDRISFRAVPVDEETSTFFAYSRSLTGYWDMGVNRGRLTDWLEQLQQQASARTEP
jgi:uncharacterized protein (DUF1499 family)